MTGFLNFIIMQVHHSTALGTKCASCGHPFKYLWFDKDEKSGKSELQFTLPNGAHICENCYKISNGELPAEDVIPKIIPDRKEQTLNSKYRDSLKSSIIDLVSNQSTTTIELERVFMFIKYNNELAQVFAHAHKYLKDEN